ncbi:MAG TPA: leucine-rich repeat domain-containing protein [Cytophagaceae bacterium]
MNKSIRFFVHIFILAALFITPAFSQKKTTKKPAPKKTTSSKPSSDGLSADNKFAPGELEQYRQRVKQIVSIFEFSLNTIGNDSTSNSDKDVLINKSYLKYFKDSKVQVEDDLDESRKVITYKNIQSYLQDVDYFFKNVKFEFNIEDIAHFVDEKDRVFFKVTLTRNLKGVTINDEAINSNRKRYIEVNINLKEKDLKIASIYTTKLSEEEELRKWWKDLSVDWKTVFNKEIGGTGDSLNYGQLTRLTNTDKIDISNTKSILDLEPLNRLSKLKELNISGSGVTNVLPLRNMTKLEMLSVDNTQVASLEPLKYSSNLKELYINNTPISKLAPLAIFTRLEKLEMNKTQVDSLEPLANLTTLKDIQAVGTNIVSLEPLKNLKNLEVLNLAETKIESLAALAELSALQQINISGTKVIDVAPLQNLKSLKVLFCNNTGLATIAPLKNSPSIEKIYCDNSKVSKDEAAQFMKAKPNSLVIYGSEGMSAWWTGLSEDWKKMYRKALNSGDNPSKEQLAGIANLTSLDLSGTKSINDLTPVKEAISLKEIKLNNTSVKSLAPLSTLNSLEVVEFSSTPVGDLASLAANANLKRVNCDNTSLAPNAIQDFINAHPATLVVYKSSQLQSWWSGLEEDYRSAFRKHTTLDSKPSNIQLHLRAKLDSISLTGNQIKSLDPITEFTNLRVLEFSNTLVSSLEPLRKIPTLKVIRMPKNPVKDLKPLESLPGLKVLDIENTGVNDLETIQTLVQIEELNCAGTQVKELKPISKFASLKVLDFSSTDVNSLKSLEEIKGLRRLKCFNTKLSAKKVEKFKTENPSCEVLYY